MPGIQKVSIALTGKQLAALEAAVDTGEYATTGEITRNWHFNRELKASGPAEPLDWARILAAARARP